MRKILLAAAALVATLAPGNAAIIADLGINPTSSQGDFSNSVGGGLFSDQYTFQLVGGPQFITIASVTNVFPQPTDFITNFTASIFADFGAPGVGGGDVLVLGPTVAQACIIPNCQVVAGSALLNPGNYFASINGTGGGTSGYGGNLATAPVPGPIAGAGIPGLIMAAGGLLGFNRFRKRRQVA
jgi:hypothetical protein